jgi:hypothetical protein
MIGLGVAVVAFGLGYWVAADQDPARLPGAPAAPFLAVLGPTAWSAQLAAAIAARQHTVGATPGVRPEA